MPFYLLSGAGFSRNWGGILAPEMFNQLIGSSLIDDELRRILWRDRSFEDVLAALPFAGDEEGKRRHKLLLSEIVGVFNGMSQSFQRREFEFRQPPDTRYSVASFLARFDALFTLNQDTLLEQKYLPFVSGKWAQTDTPGMKHLSSFVPSGALRDRYAVKEPNPSSFQISPGIQPYLKLHGSCNWVDGTAGERILIMGGQKSVRIDQFPVLSWYHQEFRTRLRQPGAKLMVIGYSFGDAHINEAILDAIKQGPLKIFLVDKEGDKVLDKRNHKVTILMPPDELMELVQSRLIGISTRPLDTTFIDDTVEHDNLIRFFQ